MLLVCRLEGYGGVAGNEHDVEAHSGEQVQRFVETHAALSSLELGKQALGDAEHAGRIAKRAALAGALPADRLPQLLERQEHGAACGGVVGWRIEAWQRLWDDGTHHSWSNEPLKGADIRESSK